MQTFKFRITKNLYFCRTKKYFAKLLHYKFNPAFSLKFLIEGHTAIGYSFEISFKNSKLPSSSI
jgi:hypothetical protein